MARRKQTSRSTFIEAAILGLIFVLVGFMTGEVYEHRSDMAEAAAHQKEPSCKALHVLGMQGVTTLTWDYDTQSDEGTWLWIKNPLKIECLDSVPEAKAPVTGPRIGTAKQGYIAER